MPKKDLKYLIYIFVSSLVFYLFSNDCFKNIKCIKKVKIKTLQLNICKKYFNFLSDISYTKNNYPRAMIM